MAGADGLDLAAVEELCRLALRARRLGCRVLLVDVNPGLRALLALAGVDDVLLGTCERCDLPCAGEHPDPDDGAADGRRSRPAPP